jgi:hypothetical protein
MPRPNSPPLPVLKFITWLALVACTAGVLFGILKILPGNQTAEKEISAELVLTGLPDGLTAAPPAVKFIGARVRGPANLVDRLGETQLTCTLNLAGRAPGLASIPLAAENFRLPETLQVSAIKPGTITLRIKTADRKTLPVYIAIAGKPATGFAVIDSFAVPANVTVTGPESRLAGMDRVMTKPIAIEGIAESIKKETALELPAGVSAAGMEKAIIADIRVAAKTERRTFPGIRVIARGTGYTAVFSPPEIVLDIKGPANALATLNRTADIAVYVDLTGLAPGVYVRRASISLPLGITLVKATPELFTVTVTKKQ